jgi:hypothetical protein
VAGSYLFTVVAAVANIPSSPSNNDAVRVSNSTGIENSSVVQNLPTGFVGDSGINVEIIYSSSASKWNYIKYNANDPDDRYGYPPYVDITRQNTVDAATLSGRPLNSTHLGTFTGSIITDNTTVKTALQELETEVETKADLVGGVVPTSQLPALAITTFLGSVSSQAAMLNLSGQRGDFAIRTDTGSTFVLTSDGGSATSHWQELATPTDAIQTVNGQAGTVVLGPSDVNALATAGGTMTGTITFASGQTFDGRDVSADGSKLDGIESGATGDQTNAEIRAAVEAATDSNVFTDADHTKLNGIEAGATGDQTDAEIRAAVEAATDSNVFTDADHTKLNGIAAGAQVNVATNLGVSRSSTAVTVTSSTGSNTSIAEATGTNAGVMTSSMHDKLDSIETNATADQTASEIRALVESASDSNVFTDADHTKLNGIAAGAQVNVATNLGQSTTTDEVAITSSTGSNITISEASSTAAGVMSSAHHDKLDGIEANATADQTAAEIRALVGSASDSNVLTNALKSKLDGIESGATGDQSAAEIRTLVGSASDSNVFTDALLSKLNGIESGATADQTSEEIQDIVGAMVSGNSESGITVTYQDSDGTLDFSVASQTDQNFTTALKNKLDGIASSATNVTNNNQLTNGAGYITGFDITTQTDSKYLRSNASDTATGDITFSGGAAAVYIAANSDIRLGAGNWTGEVGNNNAKIQAHSNHLYLQAHSQFIFRNGSGSNKLTIDSSGNLVADGNVTAYSDIRLKKDIEVIPNALDKVLSLRGVTYTDIESDDRRTGVVAQEVQSVLPEAVRENEEYLSVAYGNLVGLLIESVKELEARVRELEGR